MALAANRDEFYRRPTSPAAFWPDHPQVLAGRDLEGGGTWMGVTLGGRFAALTNYRDPSRQQPRAPSRGALVANFLTGNLAPAEYLASVAETSHTYNDFNLVAGDREHLLCLSSRTRALTPLRPGIYGLSNALLDTPWPKVVQGKARLEQALLYPIVELPERLHSVLQHRDIPEDAKLPDTGIGPERERALAAAFIQTPDYGTRSSTVLLIPRYGPMRFSEWTYDPHGNLAGLVSLSVAPPAAT